MRAVEKLNARITNNPEDSPSLITRGLLHSRLGDDRRAAEDFGKAIALEPGNVEAYHNRAEARSGLGEHPGQSRLISILKLV